MATAGSLDPTFGSGGLNYYAYVYGGAFFPSSLASPASLDGKVLVAGGYVTLAGSGPFGTSSTVDVIERLDANGTLDPTFGSGGVVQVALPSGYSGNGESLALDNPLIFANGSKIDYITTVQSGSNPVEPFVAQFNADGTPDMTFGTGGSAVFDLPDFHVSAVTLDGQQLVLAGTGQFGTEPDVYNRLEVARLTTSGQLDPDFGTAGVVMLTANTAANPDGFPFETLDGVAANAAGQVYVVGGDETPSGAEVFRLTTSGALDDTFGKAGLEVLPPATLEEAGLVAIQPDGQLILAGAAQDAANSTYPATVVRLDANGAVDASTTLGSTVQAAAQFGGIAIASNGDIVLGGDYETSTSGTSFGFSAARLLPSLAPDPTFGTDGVATVPGLEGTAHSLTIDGSGNVLLAGGNSAYFDFGPTGGNFIARLTGTGTTVVTPPPPPAPEVPGDYTGAGHADPALYFPAAADVAIRVTGQADQITPFGIPGAGQTIPAPADYDGSGKTELGVYIPSTASFAYRPAGGGPDVVTPFGVPGAGQTIPVPADYDGSGHAEIAAYLPAYGSFAYRPAGGGPDVVVPFGFAGIGQTIPAPADYFGTGRDDIAAYLPSIGAFAIRNPAGGPDEIIPFGLAGAGASIPVPGDYDGSGKAEVAVYMPSLAEFAYRPADGGPDVIVPFGAAGAGQTLPMPGDYDGSGRTEFAAYLPAFGIFAYRPSGGGPDVVEPFGIPGPGATTPFVTYPAEETGSVASPASERAAAASVEIPLPDDGSLRLEPGSSRKAKASG